MKLFAPPLLATISLLTLAACDSAAPDGSEDARLAAEETAATAGPLPTDTATPGPTASPAVTAIPPAMQGRWGLVTADCEPGRDDAKGLLTIDVTKLKFYESVGTLGTISEAGANRLRATFAFTGEGQTWQREMLLSVEEGGSVLVRTEYGEDAAPAPLRYTKCG
jgi:hypothetical protein